MFFDAEQLDRLQRTLAIIPSITNGFSSAEEIDWASLMTRIIEITPTEYDCEVMYCYDEEGNSLILDYKNLEGYSSISYPETLNETVSRLGGKENAFSIRQSGLLENGVYADSRTQQYLYSSPDGEWMPINSGVVVLDQKKDGDRLTLTIVKYQPQWNQSDIFVEGHLIGNVNQDRSLNNQTIIDYVYDHLDEFPHWQLVLKDNGDDRFYQLISMKKAQ